MKFRPHFAALFILLRDPTSGASTPNPDTITPTTPTNTTAKPPAEAAALPLTPVIKDGLSVLIEPVKKIVSVSGSLVVKVTYRNVSKTAFRLPNQVVAHPPGRDLEIDRGGIFWQMTLQEAATGKTYTSFDTSSVGLVVKAGAVIQPGETLVTMVALDRKQFHLEGQEPDKWPYGMGFIGPTGGSLSSVGNYIPTGTYQLTVNIRFPVVPAPDKDPVPLWKGDSIHGNPIEITFAPEGHDDTAAPAAIGGANQTSLQNAVKAISAQVPELALMGSDAGKSSPSEALLGEEYATGGFSLTQRGALDSRELARQGIPYLDLKISIHRYVSSGDAQLDLKKSLFQRPAMATKENYQGGVLYKYESGQNMIYESGVYIIEITPYTDGARPLAMKVLDAVLAQLKTPSVKTQ